MINYGIIAKAIGGLLFLEAILLTICWIVGLFYEESSFSTWGYSIGICLLVGLTFITVGRNARNNFGRRDGYLIVSSIWIFYSFIGMLPFLFGGHTDRVAVAFFETLSGFTTTGATAFSDIEVLPHSILFWRSLTHWIGGIGIIFFTLALLPALGIGEQKLFSAEATGLKLGKLHPRISTTAHWLVSLYILITLLCTLTYYLCGMGLFDAINHGFSTIATGGFSTHSSSISWFNSPTIEYAAMFFMFVASTNFTLLYLSIFKGRFRPLFGDEEFKLFIGLLLFSTIVVGLSRWLNETELTEHTLRETFFTTLSLISTTGFTTDDFMLWPHLSWILLTIVSITGACSGSTAGGVKLVRVLTSFKIVFSEFKHILHPHAILPIKLNNGFIATNVTRSIFAYSFFYILLVFAGTTGMIIMGYPFLDAFGLSITSFSNTGPAVGYAIGPLSSWDTLPDQALWLHSVLMLAGRLEIFSFLLPFVPSFWRDN